jgi:hypothetical protein
MSFFQLFSKIYNKELIIFGAGVFGNRLIEETDISIKYFVDNDDKKWGKSRHNIDVFPPGHLLQEDKSSIAIIIVSEAFEAITGQLERMGFQKDVHFWLNPDQSTNNQPLNNIKNIQRELLITSFSSGGGLYHITLPEQKIKKVCEGNFRGMIGYKDTFFVSDEFKGVFQYDREFNIVDQYKYENINNTHGLALDEQRKLLYVVETGVDKIGIFSINPLRRIDEIIIDTTDQDFHHMNDIWLEDGSLYVSMFSKIGNWRRGIFDGVILELDIETKQIKHVVIQNLKQPHSVKIFNDKVYYCDSMNYNFCCNGEVLGNFNSFLRGLTYDDQYFYIGQSEIKYFDRLPKTITNTSVDCGFHIYDSNHKISRFIKLPATNIYDILIIN